MCIRVIKPYVDRSIRPLRYSTKLSKYELRRCHGNKFIELGKAILAILPCC